MIDDTFLLLKMHDCSKGLDDDALQEIAEHAELVRYDSGDVIHHANDTFSFVYLIVQGRVRQAALNLHGKEFLVRFLSRGDQIGGLGAALAEPVPVSVTSHGPSTLLRIKYQEALALTLKHERFRANMSQLIAKSARQVIFGDKLRKKAALVAIFHESNASRELTIRLINRLVELGESPCVLTDQSEPNPVPGVRTRALVEGNRTLSLEEIRQQIQDWSNSKRIFLDLDARERVLNPSDLLMFCEQVYWCLEPDQWESASARLETIRAQTSVWREKIGVVWLLSKAQPKAPVVHELRELALEDYKVSLEEPEPPQSRMLVNGVERLVHHLRGIRIGVALGGGAARGMAHLGVLKALEQNGIVVDMIAGTSAGAMTGTLVASGMQPDYLVQSFVKELTPSWWFRHLPGGDQWYLLHKYRRGRFDPMLRKYLNDLRLEQLPLPMHTITVDLVSGNPVVRNRGDAVHAILESINLPVLSVPICREGQALVDGGLVNNVPADVLVAAGCNFVIAVSVTAKLESRFGQNRPDTPTEKMKTPSTLQTILRSYIVQSMNMNSVGVEPADVVIEPDVTAFDLTDFARTDEMAAVGEQATLEGIPQIKKLLTHLDDKMFSADG